MLQSLKHPWGPSLDSVWHVHVSPLLGAWNWVQHFRSGLTSAENSTTLDLLAVLCLRSPGYHLPLCESAQAACRNRHKNINKRHGVRLFLLLHQLGILQTAPRYTSRAEGRQSLVPAGGFCWFCLCIRDLHRHSLPLCLIFLAAENKSPEGLIGCL